MGPKFNTAMLFTGPEFRLTSHAGHKERDCEAMSTAVGFPVVLEHKAKINSRRAGEGGL